MVNWNCSVFLLENNKNNRKYSFFECYRYPHPHPVYTGMPLECHWLTQCTVGYYWATQRILAGYTGTPLKNLAETAHTGMPQEKLLTFAAYTGTPLEGLWQPTQAPTHIVKHTRWRDTSKQVDRSLYIQPLLVVYCSAMDTSSALKGEMGDFSKLIKKHR